MSTITSNNSNEPLKHTLYDKSYTCPVCEIQFKTKAIRVGKNQLLTIDDDLYAHYTIVNPLLYDIIACPNCQYTALSKKFDKLLPKQKEWIKNELHLIQQSAPSYREYTTTAEAIHKHKIALLLAMQRKAKLGEQSYIALHIAWLYRDLSDTKNELIFLEKAFNGFNEALQTENTPIMGLDEHTLMYMLAAIAYKLGKKEICKQYLSLVITTTGVSPRIKERALDLKEKLIHDNVIK